jgi:hypothetical protein
MDWKDELYERTKNEETIFNMKTFKLEGWYRYNDEKDFVSFIIKDALNAEEAIETFKNKFSFGFYKIDIKEIV